MLASSFLFTMQYLVVDSSEYMLRLHGHSATEATDDQVAYLERVNYPRLQVWLS